MQALAGKFPISNPCLVAGWERHDFIVDAGGAAGVVDFFVCRGWVGVFEIVHYRFVLEEGGVPGYNADVSAEGGDGDILDVVTVDQDISSLGVIEAEEETEDGRFAASWLADYGGGCAWFAVECYPVQYGVSPVIAECNVIQCDTALAYCQWGS